MENERQKRVAAIHDISCFGRCSLTVALPILSAAGIETSAIPTAVLSTHTGGFAGYTYRDLTDEILPVVRHWRSLGLGFDAIYTGFLGSSEQIGIVMEAFGLLKGGSTLIAVDPVMADNGKLYSTFAPDFPDGMRKLCAKADLIVPNLTEAALLLGEEYREGPCAPEESARMLRALCGIGPRMAVLTGVSHDGVQLGAASYDSSTGEFGYAGARRIDSMYHGTGDVFASALVAALIHGRSLGGACDAAVRFTVGAIERTRAAGTDSRFGVDFEAGLGAFAREMAPMDAAAEGCRNGGTA
ncbi:MAG: pyridoxamine kinase [Clostridiales Family XIII bacterium]|jgi:pyridoxine kinase|nr:pyridoxamine kinase [Clostridiales Family XIII bacterium]